MKSPSAPDPVQTAQAQSQYNTNTAITSQLLNMTNQTNPYGSVSYNQTGTNSFVGADGKSYTLPQFTQSTSFTPEGQKIFDNTLDAQTSLSQTAANQSRAVSDTLSKPFEFNNQDAADWSYDLAQTRIAPQQQQASQALRSQLVNSGLRPGTAAYEREMTRLGNTQTDQNNQLALTGRQQAFNEQLTTRNQPLNELNALLGQSQLQNPGSASPGTPQTQVAGVDYSGLVQSNYQNQMASHNAMMGGLFGSLGTGAQAAIMASDRRVKKAITQVATLANGLPWYTFRYRWDADTAPLRAGLMAQDVEQVRPSAVHTLFGVKHVDYAEAMA